MKPKKFSNSGSKSAIFGFSAGAGDNALFARGPRNEIRFKKDTKTASGFAVIGTTSLVGIGIRLEGARWRATKEQAIGDGGFKVSEDALDSLQMKGGWSMHELRNFFDSNGYVGSSEGQIFEGPNKVAVGRWISERIAR